MAPGDLEFFLWYVEARDADVDGQASAEPASRGSAVAVQLRVPAAGGGTQPRTFLLTCAHVVRRRDDDVLYAEILCFPPHTGYVRRGSGRRLGDAAHLEARLATVSPLSPCAAAARRGDVQQLDRYDWVLLDVGDADFQDSRAVRGWGDPPPVGARVQVGGYPGGAGSRAGDAVENAAWKDGHPVIATLFEDLKVRRSPRAGMIAYSCDDIRPGVSGGGVFDRDGLLLGLHRQLAEAQGQRRAISAAAIRDWLAAHHGAAPLQTAGIRPRPSSRRSYLLAALLVGIVLLAWRLGTQSASAPRGDRGKQVYIEENPLLPGDSVALPVQLRWGQLGDAPLGPPAAGLTLTLGGDAVAAGGFPADLPLDGQGRGLLRWRVPADPARQRLRLGARAAGSSASALLRVDPHEMSAAALTARVRHSRPAVHLVYGEELALASRLLTTLEARQADAAYIQTSEADLLDALVAAGSELQLPAASVQQAVAVVRPVLSQQRRAAVALAPEMAGMTRPQAATLQRLAGALAEVQTPQGRVGAVVVDAGLLVFPSLLLDQRVQGCPPAGIPMALEVSFLAGASPRPLRLRCIDPALQLALGSFEGTLPAPAPLAGMAADLEDRPLALLDALPAMRLRGDAAPVAVQGFARGLAAVAGRDAELLIHEAVATDLSAGAALVDLHSGMLVGFHLGARWAGLRLHGAAVPSWQLAGSPLGALLRGRLSAPLPATPVPAAGDDPLRLDTASAQALGYDAAFIGALVPLPDSRLDHSDTLGPMLDYLHHSLRLDLQRRMPAVVAVNLDRAQRVPLARSGLRWFDDPRSAALPQYRLAQFRASGLWPHTLVAAETLGWGTLYSVADLAAAAAYYRTNATLQYSSFHHQVWRHLERRVRSELHPGSRRVSLLAGPVVDAGDLYEGSLQMPQQFWLLAAYENPADPARPHLEAFVARQYRIEAGRIARLAADESAVRSIAPAQIEQLSGLLFHLPANL